jgi:hypothetical protein
MRENVVDRLRFLLATRCNVSAELEFIAADLETNSDFDSAYRRQEEEILHTRNSWLCHDFKERKIVPTHYAIRTNGSDG